MHIDGVFTLKYSGCGERVFSVGYIIYQTPVRQILEYVGEPTNCPGNRASAVDGLQWRAALEEVSEAIPELESGQTAYLTADARLDKLFSDGGASAELAPDLECDWTSGL